MPVQIPFHPYEQLAPSSVLGPQPLGGMEGITGEVESPQMVDPLGAMMRGMVYDPNASLPGPAALYMATKAGVAKGGMALRRISPAAKPRGMMSGIFDPKGKNVYLGPWAEEIAHPQLGEVLGSRAKQHGLNPPVYGAKPGKFTTPIGGLMEANPDLGLFGYTPRGKGFLGFEVPQAITHPKVAREYALESLQEVAEQMQLHPSTEFEVVAYGVPASGGGGRFAIDPKSLFGERTLGELGLGFAERPFW